MKSLLLVMKILSSYYSSFSLNFRIYKENSLMWQMRFDKLEKSRTCRWPKIIPIWTEILFQHGWQVQMTAMSYLCKLKLILWKKSLLWTIEANQILQMECLCKICKFDFLIKGLVRTGSAKPAKFFDFLDETCSKLTLY